MATAAAGTMQRTLSYNTWVAMTVGSTNSAAAREFGPRLWKASAFTRAEAAQLRAHPDRIDDARQSKQDAFDHAASDLKDTYPDAYQYLAGHQNGDRITAATLGWVGWFATATPALVLGALMLFLGAMIALGIGILPVAALAGAHRRFAGVITGPVNYIGNAVLAVALFGAITAAHTAAAGGLLEPAQDKNPLLALLLLLALTAGTFILLWPVLKTISPRRLAHAVTAGNRRGRDVDDVATSRSRRRAGERAADEPAGAKGPGRTGEQIPSPRGHQDPVPAEAQRRQAPRAALTGAARGATAGVVAGALTAGGATAAAAAAGAAKGAVTGAAAEAAPAATRALTAVSVAGQTAGKHRVAGTGAGWTAPTAPSAPSAPQSPPAPAPAEAAAAAGPGAAPVRPRVRIYRPDEDTPARTLAPAPGRTRAGQTTYTIYTPAGAAP
jgi:hypothetical protein